jgi:hypothetical protein
VSWLGDFPHRKDGVLTLSQAKYISSVLSRYGMDVAYGAHTPMEAGVDLYGASEPADDMPYREAIGSLIYLMVGIRPDIAFALSQLSKFVESPTRTHWTAVTRILRYVKQTRNHGLCYRSSDSFKIEGYCDSDWGGDRSTRRSTS